jgi:hypothetical protein
MIYTYLYKDPKTNIPVYIEKGTNERAWDHLSAKTRLGNLLRKRIREGYEIYPIINFEIDDATALFMEEVWIEQYGRADLGTGTLFNLTNGGEGESGRKHTEETKRKIGLANSISQKGQKQSLYTINKRISQTTGRKRSNETKLMMSLAKFGKTFTVEHKEALSKARKGKPWSQARINAQINRKRGN